MDDKTVRRHQLFEASIDDPRSARLIDDYYTDFRVAEDDRECLERFLCSSDIDVREEAILALAYAPGFTGYAQEALVLHVLGIVADLEAQYTGVSALVELESKGDREAARLLQSLLRNEPWKRTFFPTSRPAISKKTTSEK